MSGDVFWPIKYCIFMKTTTHVYQFLFIVSMVIVMQSLQTSQHLNYILKAKMPPDKFTEARMIPDTWNTRVFYVENNKVIKKAQLHSRMKQKYCLYNQAYTSLLCWYFFVISSHYFHLTCTIHHQVNVNSVIKNCRRGLIFLCIWKSMLTKQSIQRVKIFYLHCFVIRYACIFHQC